MALSQSAIIFFFSNFVSGNLALTGFYLFTRASDFYCFGALGVRQGRVVKVSQVGFVCTDYAVDCDA